MIKSNNHIKYLFFIGLICLVNNVRGYVTIKTIVPVVFNEQQTLLKHPFNFSQVSDHDKVFENIDDKVFKLFLKHFKEAVKKADQSQLKTMLHFPLQTLPQWTSEDLKNGSVNLTEGLITVTEYPTYASIIFNKDAIKLIPKSTDDNLSEIDNNITENYYTTIKKITDKGSTLYELQQQYEQKNGKETSYGFVFGKIKGQYKVISYFCPWPLKD